jgi:flavodoxin
LSNKEDIEELANIIADGMESHVNNLRCNFIANQMKEIMDKEDFDTAMKMAAGILNERGIEKPDTYKNVIH